MKKLAIPLSLFLLSAFVLCLIYHLTILQTKYVSQSNDIRTLHQQIKTLKREVFYLQSMNYTEYLITKKHWEVINRTYKNKISENLNH